MTWVKPDQTCPYVAAEGYRETESADAEPPGNRGGSKSQSTFSRGRCLAQ